LYTVCLRYRVIYTILQSVLLSLHLNNQIAWVHYLILFVYLDFLNLKRVKDYYTYDVYNLHREILHLGITEAGGARSGSIKSAIGLGMLLAEGIGDTLRVSLAADPTEEVKVGFDILKSLRIRSRGINFIACPTCSRQEFDVINTVNELERRLENIITPMDVSIIGCVVNGPGEALASTMGIAGGNNKSGFYEDGVRIGRIDNDAIIDELEVKIRAKAQLLANKIEIKTE